MKIEHVHRIIFFAFWLYFFAFRGILGRIRLIDYFAFFLVPIGIVLFILNKKAPTKIIKWVSIITLPIIIPALIDPSEYILLFVLKLYLAALYFAIYFKIMKLSYIELMLFIFPFVISIYYFFFPRPEDYIYLMQNRMAGISEPNFTSLFLIISMCGAFGIHLLINKRSIKIFMIIIVLICCYMVILTASRAGFVSAIIALSLFAIIKKIKWYIVTPLIIFAIYIGLNLNVINEIMDRIFVFTRFQSLFKRSDSLIETLILERPYTQNALEAVLNDKWFIAGGAQRVSSWVVYNFAVPHNSFVDLGLGFGKASFYFYSALFVFLLWLNIFFFIKARSVNNTMSEHYAISSVFFLSLIPMFIFLSSGMTFCFIFWVILGFYPLLQYPLKGWRYSIIQQFPIIKLR